MAAVWGNANMDNEKEPQLRQNFMDDIDERYSRAIAILYGDIVPDQPGDDDYDPTDPFWAAMEKGVEENLHKLVG